MEEAVSSKATQLPEISPAQACDTSPFDVNHVESVIEEYGFAAYVLTNS